jgi:hypothetical protein
MPRTDIYVESGTKRTFAAAVDWPGWCRWGRSEQEAVDALLAYGPKYEAVLADTGLRFTAPSRRSDLNVVERLSGTVTTDFGAPAVPPSADEARTCTDAEVERLVTILEAGWRAFDTAVESARGQPLARGPRGGGRSLDAIVAHVLEADAAYLSGVGWKAPRDAGDSDRIGALRQAMLDALHASASGAIPDRGPRGGNRWTARYFLRRAAWHVISHAWEIERRREAAS